MPSTDHARASLDLVLRSGQYVKRPHRQIFVEHTFTNRAGQITRQVTKNDLVEAAANGNRSAATTGDLAPIGIGHTYDDICDEQGNLVRKFSEADQPKPIGYLHNYSVEQLADGRWALFADEYIQKVITTDKGEQVDGVRYAESFPRRSAEYFPSRKWIDWLALLRRAPALNMGLDLYAFAHLNPDRAYYDANKLLVESRSGKWRYEGDDMDLDDDDKPTEEPNPAEPPDDRPPVPAQPEPDNDELPEEHRTAAERYAAHCYGMHHTQARALLQDAHTRHAARLGLPPDKMAPHNPPAPAAPAVPAAASPMSAPSVRAEAGGAPAAPAAPAAPSAGTPGPASSFIPGFDKEKQRMSANQQAITKHRYSSELEAERNARQQLEARIEAMEMDRRKANYERDLTALLGQGYEFTLSKEVGRMEPLRYSEAACQAHIACIKENYQRAPMGMPGGGFMVHTVDAEPPAATGNRATTKAEKEKAMRYALDHDCDFDAALTKIRGA